jgi:integrase
MRIGEIQALKWKDIDFENRLIEVKRSCRHGRFSNTKNKEKRRVDMSLQLTRALLKLKKDREQIVLDSGKPDPEFVFVNTKGGPMCREAFRDALNTCLDKAKLPKVRIHDLRHAYATIRLMRGHNVGDVSYQLGHSSIAITYDVYGHWIPGNFKSQIDELDNVRITTPLQNKEIGCV